MSWVFTLKFTHPKTPWSMSGRLVIKEKNQSSGKITENGGLKKK